MWLQLEYCVPVWSPYIYTGSGKSAAETNEDSGTERRRQSKSFLVNTRDCAQNVEIQIVIMNPNYIHFFTLQNIANPPA